jgi:membrane protein DedA with SNARE-associated domain
MSFDQILEFINSQNAFLIYAILLVSAFIENVFPPFPGDAVMLAGAYIAGEGGIDYIGVLISTVAGGTLGAMTLYAIGRKGGRKFFISGKGQYLIKGNIGRAENLYARYGNFLILISRFLAGIRSAIAVAAGVVNFNVYRMTILTFLSFVLWNTMLLGLMVYSKSNWRMIVEIIKSYNIVLLTIGTIILIAWITRALWIKRRNSKLPS